MLLLRECERSGGIVAACTDFSPSFLLPHLSFTLYLLLPLSSLGSFSSFHLLARSPPFISWLVLPSSSFSTYFRLPFPPSQFLSHSFPYTLFSSRCPYLLRLPLLFFFLLFTFTYPFFHLSPHFLHTFSLFPLYILPAPPLPPLPFLILCLPSPITSPLFPLLLLLCRLLSLLPLVLPFPLNLSSPF